MWQRSDQEFPDHTRLKGGFGDTPPYSSSHLPTHLCTSEAPRPQATGALRFLIPAQKMLSTGACPQQPPLRVNLGTDEGEQVN